MKSCVYILAFMLLVPIANAQSGPSAATDQVFVTKAVQGGLAEVALAEMALDKSSAAGVKDFARMMVRDHGKANEELTQTARRAGANVPTEPSAEQKAIAAKLGVLSGVAFDEAYATTMIEDHQETIELFEREAAQGENSALKAFAKETLPTLKTHLDHSKRLPGAG